MNGAPQSAQKGSRRPGGGVGHQSLNPRSSACVPVCACGGCINTTPQANIVGTRSAQLSHPSHPQCVLRCNREFGDYVCRVASGIIGSSASCDAGKRQQSLNFQRVQWRLMTKKVVCTPAACIGFLAWDPPSNGRSGGGYSRTGGATYICRTAAGASRHEAVT